MSTEETRATVEAFYAALTKGNRDAVRDLLSDDCAWVPPATAPLDEMKGGDEIAAELFISPATVRTHVGRAMLKLSARDRAQLVVLSYETGLVTPGHAGT